MKISVITVNFNNKDGLKLTLDSVEKQSCEDYEVIVVDGASTDGSALVVEEYANRNSWLRYVSEKDKGIYNAMNKGIDMSKGEYLIFMNSGDSFYDDKTMELSEPYLDGNIDIVSGIAVSANYIMMPVKPQDLSLSFFLKSSMNHQSTFIKRSLMLEYHYNENYRIAGDTEFFVKAMILGGCSYKDIHIKVSYCEVAGISGNIKESLIERYEAIKKLLPERMSNDVDFIIKYSNPVMICIGNLLYNEIFRFLYDKVVRRGRRI